MVAQQQVGGLAGVAQPGYGTVQDVHEGNMERGLLGWLTGFWLAPIGAHQIHRFPEKNSGSDGWNPQSAFGGLATPKWSTIQHLIKKPAIAGFFIKWGG